MEREISHNLGSPKFFFGKYTLLLVVNVFLLTILLHVNFFTRLTVFAQGCRTLIFMVWPTQCRFCITDMVSHSRVSMFPDFKYIIFI